MNETYAYTLKLKAGDTGTAFVVKYKDGYYLLSALHVVQDTEIAKIIDVDDNETKIDVSDKAVSTEDTDICVMRLPNEVAEHLTLPTKCATFEGSGYHCQIEGFPSNAVDKRIRIEDDCIIEQESEVGDGLYVKLQELRNDGMRMDDLEAGFSGSGVFVNSNGEKYAIGLVYRVDSIRNQFVGWKMQKINEVLRAKEWEEIPLVPIELNEEILRQYKALIEKSNEVLSRINDSIMGKIILPRDSYRGAISEAINRNNGEDVSNVVVVTGDAGIGKSALTKAAILAMGINSVAILGDDLDAKSNIEINANLRIKDDLSRLYQSPVWSAGKKVVLVESAERMFNGNTDTAILFIKQILNANKDTTFVFTIRKQALSILRIDLMANGIKVAAENVIEIGPLTNSELNEVALQVRHITPYVESDKARSIVSIPYYLNIVCSLGELEGIDLSDDNIKDILCRRIVEGDHDNIDDAKRRVECLIDIARQSANTSMGLVPCEVTDVVKSLEDDDIISANDVQTKFRPNHDLLADWAIGEYIEENYKHYIEGKISLQVFYSGLDRNVVARNVFKSKLKAKIETPTEAVVRFYKESLLLDLNDFVYDDLFYSILDSENGAHFLTDIKDVLVLDDGRVVKKIGNALSYMFRDIDFDGRMILERSGVLDPDVKYRNSQFILPVGKGWKTFVEFLYENRDVFYKYRHAFVPLLLECELVKIKEDEIGNLPQQVFEILMTDAEQWLHTDARYHKYENRILRLLFKWIKKGKERVGKFAEDALYGDSYKHDQIRQFILTEGDCMYGFQLYFPDVYKSILNKDWLDENGIVEEYYNLHIASASSTSFYSYFFVDYKSAIKLLCDILNYDIDKQKAGIEKVSVSYDGNNIDVYGNDFLWREYRGINYHSHIQECLLMAFEKWLLDCVRNNLSKAPYALSQEQILSVFDLIYVNCHNVAAWAVLASVATCYPQYIGLKAMPIYSSLIFIRWDKTRYSTEFHGPFTSPLASKKILNEIKESYERPHRKNDLEYAILILSMTKGYEEKFEALIEHYKQIATTFEEKVAIGRMDKTQYKIISKNEHGYVLQGSPYDDIIEDAKRHDVESDFFTSLIEKGNIARKMYDVEEPQDVEDWRKAYALRDKGEKLLSPDNLTASWGVKSFWSQLDCSEKRWCVKKIVSDVEEYCATHSYPIYIEYTSDALLYILLHQPDSKTIKNNVLCLIDSIDDNDSMFIRFENTFKNQIWKTHPDVADEIICRYLVSADIKKDDLQKFTQVCKLIPVDRNDSEYDELVEIYTRKYVAQWSEDRHNRYGFFHNTRVETFLAGYMLDAPKLRERFIRDIWLNSLLGDDVRLDDNNNPVSNVYTHFCYLVTKENRDKFWELWTIMFEWYKSHRSSIVLSALLFHFELMRLDLLNNWEVIEGAHEYINKLLDEIEDDGQNLLPRLLCRIGYKELLPESFRYINRNVLKSSSRDSNNFVLWENAVEDLYDDSKLREVIRNDDALRIAYVEILNGLISNGSAISYIIRDYYI